MRNLDLDAIEARASLATAGPWRPKREAVSNDWFDQCPSEATPVESRGTAWAFGVAVACASQREDAVFIAAARQDVPALVAEVRGLRDELRKERALPTDVRRTRDEIRATLESLSYAEARDLVSPWVDWEAFAHEQRDLCALLDEAVSCLLTPDLSCGSCGNVLGAHDDGCVVLRARNILEAKHV